MLDLDVIFDPDRPTPAVDCLWFVKPPDLPTEWWFAWDERAAIMEFEAGIPRERAEALALKDVLRQRANDPAPNLADSEDHQP